MADIVYRVDDRDRIVFLCEGWDAFAAANGGARASSANVLHRPLWDFVADATTQDLYRSMLNRARAGRPARFTLRCDSPTRRRLLEMNLGTVPGGVVEFRTRLLSEEGRPAQGLLESSAGRTGEILLACSWCNKILVGGDWAEAEQAAELLRLFELPAVPMLSHGICPPCLQRVTEELSGS